MKPALLYGERPYGLTESALIEKLFSKAREVFGSFGYDYLQLSSFEPYELQEKAFNEGAKKAITFKETSSGDLLALRLDFTTQLVRTVSSLKRVLFPKRLYYFGPLYSLSEKGFEGLQTGVELLGEGSVEADAEVVEALYAYLKALGIKEVKVILGHAGVARKLAGNDEELIKAFAERNLELLGRRFGPKLFELVSVSDEAPLGLLDELGLKKEREELERAAGLLAEAGVSVLFDLCELRPFPYYDGITFELFEEKSGRVLAGGGRYDGLSRLYGAEFPATGGAAYLERLLELMPQGLRRKDYFVVDRSSRGLGRKLARLLRGREKAVALELSGRPLEKSLQYAFAEGFKEVLVVEDETLRVYSTPKSFVTLRLEEFLKLAGLA
ncbi:MAG: hypothetical protein GXO03_04350 [Aquificae bacterium]|nr:hypothetical protein [Aquificota bacterium]